MREEIREAIWAEPWLEFDEALAAAQLIERVQDPVRDNRPTYHAEDPLIRFHYAVIRRHQISALAA